GEPRPARVRCSAPPHRRTRSLRRRRSNLGLRGLAENALSRQDSRHVMRYLADSSALWRLLRDPAVRAGWTEVISDHAIGSCQPQRTDFRRSAQNHDEYEQMSSMFVDLYPTFRCPRQHGNGSSQRSTDCYGPAPIERCPAWTCSSVLVRPSADSWSCTTT